MRRPFYYRETHGIRVSVRPAYLAEHSRPAEGRYVFTYAVRIENSSRRTVQLLSRRWLIYERDGAPTEVVGDGVIGEQPTLAHGAVHEYESFCILQAPVGAMEGSYRFRALDETLCDAVIPRFDLVVGDDAADDLPF